MRPLTTAISLIVAQILALASQAAACDPCSLYNASRLQGLTPGTVSVAVSNQLTTFDRSQPPGQGSIKNGESVREYSTTQIAASYDFNREFGLQVNLPVISRNYDQITNYRYKEESETGFGDMSILGRYSFLNYREGEWSVIAGINGGIKLPTGDTGSLGQVTEEESADPRRLALRHHVVSSASGGRALTLGSGSTDFITGASLFARYQRILFLTDVQYTFRTEGSFDYQFADDFIWSVGPGYYVYVEHDDFIALRLAVIGEFKGADDLQGERVAGSGFSNFYVGPEILFSVTSSISGQLGLDMRTTGEDAGASVVPEMRLRSALAYRF